MNVGYPDENPAPRASWRIALLVAVAALLVWKFAVPSNGSLVDPNAQPRLVAPRGDLAPEEIATIEIFERCSPSVVFIRNVAVQVDRFRQNPTMIREGTGSGFIWDSDGHVVTNYHVIHGGTELQVILGDQTWKAQVVGYEVEKDIAVLKIAAPKESLVPVAIGASGDLKVGQNVFAIGNPFGLDHTLTTGIISGLGREMMARYEEEGRGQRPITDLIQTDAAINPGNSGGPLLDSGGRLIGMNTAIVSESGSYSGVGFAIPVDTINRTVTEILRFGKASRPGLGINPLNDSASRQLRVDGVVVYRVQPNTAAARAGLRSLVESAEGYAFDAIVAINGAPIHNQNDLFRELGHHQVGDRVKLKVLRDGQQVDIDVELQDVH
jgi:S1-C subfamily serine protease